MTKEEAWLQIEDKVREIGTTMDDVLGMPKWIILDHEHKLQIRLIDGGEVLFETPVYEEREIRSWNL